MAAMFGKNKSRIQAILEKQLPILVPKLFSLELISKVDRNLALNTTIDSSTRAASLFDAIEKKIASYQDLLLFVDILLSSRIDSPADRAFIEGLPASFEGVSVPPATSRPRPDAASGVVKRGGAHALQTAQEATALSGESETVTSQESVVDIETVENSSINPFFIHSSVWYKHSQEFPGIKFSNYYTKERVTFRGGVVKGEGIELQIPGHAIDRDDSVEFTVQGCIDGPFELPDDVSFASPVFVVTPHYEFQKEVTIGIDTFVDLQSYQDWKDMVFLTSPAKPKIDGALGPYWEFKVNDERPQCIRKSSFVRVQVKHLCLLCFGIRRRVPRYQYTACLYSPCSAIDKVWCRAVFSVSLTHEVYIRNLKIYLESFRHPFQESAHETFHLTQDRIQLILPQDTKSLGYYDIVANKSPCEILKSVIELPCHSRKHRKHAKRNMQYPPRIMLTVTYKESLSRPNFCELKVNGIEGLKAFNMSVPPGGLVSPQSSASIKQIISDTQGPSSRLSMGNLLHLPLTTTFVNIPREVGVQWYLFCGDLLKDDVAAVIQKKSVTINTCILREWLDGRGKKPVSWETLANAIPSWIQRDILPIDMPHDFDNQLKKSVESYDGPLTMSTLHNFPTKDGNVDIPTCLEGHHLRLGKHLLRDETGTYIHELAHINCEELNKDILQIWLNGQGGYAPSARSLQSALQLTDHIKLTDSISSYSGPFTMNILLNFPIVECIATKSANVPREVGDKYFDFGIHLLQDDTGAHMRDLERELRGNGEDINKRVLHEWLSGEGRPVTWATLVEVLNIIGKGELAKEIAIETRYNTSLVQSK